MISQHEFMAWYLVLVKYLFLFFFVLMTASREKQVCVKTDDHVLQHDLRDSCA